MKEKLSKIILFFKNKLSCKNVKRIISSIFAAIVFFGIIAHYLDNILTFWERHFSSSSGYSKLEPFDKKDFGILVAPFSGSTEELATKGMAIQATIRSTLNARFKELEINDGKVREIPTSISPRLESHEQARKIGIEYDADLVIWGDITIAGIIPNMTVVDKTFEFSRIIDDENTILKSSLSHFQLNNNTDIRLFDLTDEPLSVVSFVTGFKLYTEGNLENALKYFLEAIPKIKTKYIRLSSIYFFVGNIYFYENKPCEALIYYNKSIEADEYNDMAYNNRGTIYYMDGKIDEALSNYNKALDINPNNVIAHLSRSYCYINKGDIELALADISLAIKLYPKYYDAYFYRGNIYFDLKEYEKAIADYCEAIIIEPNNISAYANRGAVYQSIKEYQKAILDYSKVIEIDPKNSIAYNYWGTALSAQGNYLESIEKFKKAIDIDPNYIKAYLTRGFAYHSINEYQNAIQDFKKVTEIDPKNFIAYYNWGAVLSDKGNFLESIEKFKKATEIDSNQADAYYNWGFALNELVPRNIYNFG